MKIVTWNVNSINVRTEQLYQFIETHNPDIILMQELKCQTSQFPSQIFSEKYQLFINGQKAYNGVGILVKKEIQAELIATAFSPEFESEARYIEVLIEGKIIVASIYVPNGQTVDSPKFPYKLSFLQNLKDYIKKKSMTHSVILGGDFNVAPYDIDVKNPDKMRESLGFNSQEHAKLRAFYDEGFYDPFRLVSQDQQFSWWDYRGGCFQKDDGMRLDYFFITSDLTSKVKKVSHHTEFRILEKPSDHIPVMTELHFN